MKKIVMMIMMFLLVVGSLFSAQQTILNGELFGVGFGKTNDNFTELYTDIDTLGLRLDTLDTYVIEFERVTQTANVMAFLSDSTFVVATDTFEPITSVFTNVFIDNFTLGTNSLILGPIDSDSVFVQILGSISLSCNKNGAIVTFAIKKNNDVVPGSPISREYSVGTIGSMSGICGTWIAEADSISIVVKSSVNNSELSLLNIRTSLGSVKWSD